MSLASPRPATSTASATSARVPPSPCTSTAPTSTASAPAPAGSMTSQSAPPSRPASAQLSSERGANRRYGRVQRAGDAELAKEGDGIAHGAVDAVFAVCKGALLGGVGCDEPVGVGIEGGFESPQRAGERGRYAELREDGVLTGQRAEHLLGCAGQAAEGICDSLRVC